MGEYIISTEGGNLKKLIDQPIILSGKNNQAAFLRMQAETFPYSRFNLKEIFDPRTGLYYATFMFDMNKGVDHLWMLNQLSNSGIHLDLHEWGGVNFFVFERGTIKYNSPTKEDDLIQPTENDPRLARFLRQNGFQPTTSEDEWGF